MNAEIIVKGKYNSGIIFADIQTLSPEIFARMKKLCGMPEHAGCACFG